jgi:hypothetical protein
LGSTGLSTERSFTGGTGFVDTAQIDLGGNASIDIAVLANGTYYDQAVGGALPIQVTNVPRQSSLLGRALNTLPGLVNSEVDLSTPTEASSLATRNGNMVMNWDLGTEASTSKKVGSAMYYWGGAQDGWRLSNNAPSLTTAQRDSRSSTVHWVQGDIIYNLTTGTLQVLVGTTWKNISLT